MKSSLIWRCVLIVFVMAIWIYSLFPLKDRDFLPMFEKMAAPKVAAISAEAQALEKSAAEIKTRRDAITDTASGAWKNLDAEYQDAVAKAKGKTQKLEVFNAVLAESRQALAGNATVAPYTAVRDAARGTGKRSRLNLNEFIEVPTQPRASNNLVLSWVRKQCRGKLQLGLDLRGGTEFIIGFDPSKLQQGQDPETTRDQITEILRNRLDSMGLVEPELKPIGPTAISLRMPSVSEDEKSDVRRTIKQTATLSFQLVHQRNDELVRQYQENPAAFTVPSGYELREMEVEHNNVFEVETLLLQRAKERLGGEHINNAFATFNEFGNWSVSLEFNGRGASRFAEITTENVGRRLAIVLDGTVYSAPVIQTAITQGRAEISGSFSPEEAKRLAGVIQSGNLPVTINIDSEFGADPTLGRDSIESGTRAALWGLVLVVGFMLVYYRLAGAVANIALLANIVLVLGTLTLAGATITLPGIAGIVLTIGMAVDTNVLIFERIREELNNGKTIGNAIVAGYDRALVTILDSNLTTLLTAIIMYRFGTGPIRGFAVTLGIGIVASMFTALYVTRWIFDLLIYTGRIKTLKMMSFFKDPKIDFLGVCKPAAAISIGFIVLSLIVAVYRGRDALSIDFAGGTAVAYAHKPGVQPPDVKDVRAALETAGYKDSRIGYKFSTTDEGKLLEVVLRGHSTDEGVIDLDALTASLQKAFPEQGFEQVQTNSVGSLIGAQLQTKAFWAGLLSIIGIILYVSFRYEFAYGVAAVIALIHDVAVATGVYLICGRQLSLPMVAALLTIIGYSLNDTIVIFDRIREDLTLVKNKPYREIVNLSINQTLSRTILTSLTTLIVVITLFLFGGGAINDFSLVMLAGVIVGTYSTVYIATAIVAVWHKRSLRNSEETKPAAAAV